MKTSPLSLLRDPTLFKTEQEAIEAANNTESGLGREGSQHGMDDNVEIKFLCLGDILK